MLSNTAEVSPPATPSQAEPVANPIKAVAQHEVIIIPSKAMFITPDLSLV
jgi:hypothetical protein